MKKVIANKNIRLIELHTILINGMFIIPVLVPYYQQVIGLSFQDFLIGEAAFAAVVLLLEVPSGWLSDVWKRKYVLALGGIFDAAGFAILLYADSLAMTILAQVIIGVAISLFSGTNSALLYDSLIESGQEKEFGRLEGRRSGFGMYAIAIASIIGGLMYAVSPKLPIYASIATQALTIAVSLAMKEPQRHKSAVQGHPIADMLATMRYALHGHVEVGFILLFSAALFCGTKLNMWIQQPYYMELGIPEAWFGALMAAGFATGGLSSHFGHLMFRGKSNISALAWVWAFAITVCLGAAVIVGMHGIVLLMAGGSLIYGLAMPRIQEAINIRVGSERRATILSTASLLQQLAFIPMGVLIGALVDSGGAGAGLFGVASWLAASGAFLALWALGRSRNKSPAVAG